jgi:hypothetical protein
MPTEQESSNPSHAGSEKIRKRQVRRVAALICKHLIAEIGQHPPIFPRVR